VPEPSVVVEFAVVGFGDVFQHIPLEVTDWLPSFVTFPPDEAEVVVTEEAAVVVNVGTKYGGPKLAIIFISEFKVTVSGLVEPETSPDQLINEPPPLATAVRVTSEPFGKLAEFRLDAVLIPEGLLVTFPLYPPEDVVETWRFLEVIPPLIVALKSSVVP
jgi:hypothetical protein